MKSARQSADQFSEASSLATSQLLNLFSERTTKINLLGRITGLLDSEFFFTLEFTQFRFPSYWYEIVQTRITYKQSCKDLVFARLQKEIVMLTVLSLTSVFIHGQYILWVSGKQHAFWKGICLTFLLKVGASGYI